MSEPTPAPVPKPVRPRWRRARIYGWVILVILAVWLLAVVTLVRQQPKRVVDHGLAQLPFSSSTGKVIWLDDQTLQLSDVKVGDFFYADSIVISLNGRQVLRRHIPRVQVTGCQVFTKALEEAMKKFGPDVRGLNWTIDKLEIRRGTVMMENFVPDTPSIPILLGVSRPIILDSIKLNKPDSSPSMNQERTVEVENITLVSPFDPLASVLAFPLTRVRFTYSELWRHHIREVDFVRPVMHLGEDLFWFSNEFKKQRAAASSEGVTAPWEVGHLEVQYGQLALNVFGQPAAHLPFFFETKVDDIRLDQLDKISAKSTISIIRLDQEYPDYKIRIVNLHGKLEFSLPPSDATANNVVPTVFIDELSWNEIPATEVWSTVTFDSNGIYGNLGGKCESGYLKANFEVYYTKGFTWNANLFADKINCQPVAERVAGKYIDLSGTLDGKIAVQGKATEILNCQGTLDLAHPGVLEIKSMDNLLKRLPANASVTKKDLMNIAVTSFKIYPYRSGEFKIDYKPEGGTGTLKLDSPNGQRQLDIYWHPYETSKVANEANNQ
jgi:hypothetical protein